jgi:3-oxoacyl-[acyl-carrier protein] reductase
MTISLKAPPRQHRLEGKTALVTGSTSGIGRGIAVALAAAGAGVIIHGRRPSASAEQLLELLRGQGADTTALFAELGDIGTHEPLVDVAWSWRGGVDIWVNNAGADVLTGDNLQLPFEEKLDRLWKVDVRATIQLSRLVGARMKLRTDVVGGVILNVGWDQAEHGMGGDSGEMFAAAKGAIMSFSRSLAHSLAPEVRVNCLAPGWIRTAWAQTASEAWQQRAIDESLKSRWGTPEDVASVACFLASPAADFLTGQVVPINGGFRHGK